MATTAANHWKLGLFVLFGLAIAVVASAWLGARSFRRASFPAVTFFDESVQGLDIGSPVKFRGVPVGTVADITVAPDRRHVQVTADVYVDSLERLGISENTRTAGGAGPFMAENLRVQLVSAGITGVRFLQVDFFDPARFPKERLPFPEPWNYIASAPSSLKSLEESVTEILNRMPTLEDQASGALAEATTTLTATRKLILQVSSQDGAVNKLVHQLDVTAAALQKALDESQLGVTTAELRQAAGAVTEAANALSGVTDGLDGGVTSLREALDAVRALASSLERDPSALLRGKRVTDTPPVRPQ